MFTKTFKKVCKKVIELKNEFDETSLELGSKIVNKLDDTAISEISAGSVIGMAISLIVIAAVIPSAIQAFYDTNTSTWLINGAEDTKATTLWWLLPFICVAVVLYMVYKRMD